jgi:fumarate hydratase subunit beta
MTDVIRISAPLSKDQAARLRAGDMVELSGTIYTARDAAHKRLIETMDRGEPLPFPLEGAVIYYAGPSPAPPGKPIGAVGPTTSGRMDAYAPRLIAAGLRGMIGKGNRIQEVKDAGIKFGAVYLSALGGAGALMAQAVKTAEVIAYDELGPEAIRRLTVENMPLVVINDVTGADLYEQGRQRYAIK